jgi:prefoldin subunit 5
LETDKAIKQVHAEVDQLCAERDKIDAAISAAKERWRALEKARVGETRFHQSIAKPEKPRDFNRLSVSRSDASPTDRLDRLEKQVNSILAEIHELKSQQHEPVNRE